MEATSVEPILWRFHHWLSISFVDFLCLKTVMDIPLCHQVSDQKERAKTKEFTLDSCLRMVWLRISTLLALRCFKNGAYSSIEYGAVLTV